MKFGRSNVYSVDLQERGSLMATDNEPLDSETHEKYLDVVTDKLEAILSEIRAIRDDLGALPKAIAAEIRSR
jgi:hypothetical protein